MSLNAATPDTQMWPELKFGPINLWSLPAAWKTEHAANPQSLPARKVSNRVTPAIQQFFRLASANR